jgi:O-antigen/teichoic acid export membrane protein
VGINFIAIPLWGIRGAGASTVIGYAVLVYLGWRNAQRSYPVNYEWWRVIKITAVVSVVLLASVLAIPPTGAAGLSIRIALAALFPFLLIAAGVLSRGEQRIIRQRLIAMGMRRSPQAVIQAEEEEAVEEEPVAEL